MNREEADVIVMQTLEWVLRMYERYRTDDKFIAEIKEAFDIAIAALRGPQPDPDTGLAPCDFCTDTFDQKPLFQENKYKPYTRMMSTISIEEYNGKHQIEIDLWDGANVYAAFEINYCPMCGRKLEVEG